MSNLKTQRMDWGTLGETCKEGQKYGECTKLGGKTLVLYHGTRVSPEKIMEEGLLIRAGLTGKDTRMQMVDNALGEFGYTRKKVPKWIWEGEWNYERTIEPHLHMSTNVGTAVGYSHQGCEIKAQIRTALISWIITKVYGDKDMSIREIDEKLGCSPSKIAIRMNGKSSYVYCVEIPRNFVRKEDLQGLEGASKRYGEKIGIKERDEWLNRTTREVRVVENIPPNMIKRVWKVNFKGKFVFAGYELERVK